MKEIYRRNNKKNIKSNEKRLLRGVYTTSKNFDLLVAYALRYSQAVISLNTALTLYGYLINSDYDIFDFSFKRGSRAVKDIKIHQNFISQKLFDIGITNINYGEYSLRIYDRERLLIEIFRFSDSINKKDYDKAIKNIIKDVKTKKLDTRKFDEYASKFPNYQALVEKYYQEIILKL